VQPAQAGVHLLAAGREVGLGVGVLAGRGPRHLAPAFRKAGWTVEDLGRGGHGKQLRWRTSAPVRPEMTGEDARACLQRPQDDADAGMMTAGMMTGHLRTTGKRKRLPAAHSARTAPALRRLPADQPVTGYQALQGVQLGPYSRDGTP
jgi:hypothetical protein